MLIKCVTAATQAGGGPGFHACVIQCTKSQYDNGDHYDAAKSKASDDGYDGNVESMVTFDEKDGPAWLFERFDWAEEKPIRV